MKKVLFFFCANFTREPRKLDTEGISIKLGYEF